MIRTIGGRIASQDELAKLARIRAHVAEQIVWPRKRVKVKAEKPVAVRGSTYPLCPECRRNRVRNTDYGRFCSRRCLVAE